MKCCGKTRRVLVRICIFLLLGAIVNVAVAWGFVLFEPSVNRDNLRWPSNELSNAILHEVAPDIAITETDTAGKYIFTGWQFTIVIGYSRPSHTDARTWVVTVDHGVAGWPAGALEGSVLWKKHAGQVGTTKMYYYYALQVPESIEPSGAPKQFARFLPLRPMWPGFAINTIVYAVALQLLWLLFAAPFALRRWWRVRLGLCVRCAYPIGASDVCTECGLGGAEIGSMTKRRVIRRRLVRVVVFLLLGSTVNVAVAWGFVCWSGEVDVIWNSNTKPREIPWQAPVPESWPSKGHIWRGDSFGLTEFHARGITLKHNRIQTEQWVFQAGWPFRSLYLEHHRTGPREYGSTSLSSSHYIWVKGIRSEITWRDGIRIPYWIRPLGQKPIRRLPIFPIFPGFAINSILYGAILWMLFATVCSLRLIVRRRRRARRGLCRKCAYPVGVSDVCTECGRAVRR